MANIEKFNTVREPRTSEVMSQLPRTNTGMPLVPRTGEVVPRPIHGGHAVPLVPRIADPDIEQEIEVQNEIIFERQNDKPAGQEDIFRMSETVTTKTQPTRKDGNVVFTTISDDSKLEKDNESSVPEAIKKGPKQEKNLDDEYFESNPHLEIPMVSRKYYSDSYTKIIDTLIVEL